MSLLSPRPAIFGEVLVDRFADREVMGGAPFNVAWHLCAFGLQPLFISRVGEDAAGQDILRAMERWGMDTSGVQRDPSQPTGAVDVSLGDDGEPTYAIVHPVAYDGIDPAQLPTLATGSLLYHGSLALRDATSRSALASLQSDWAPLRFVDINLRTPWYQGENIGPLLEGARWLKLNQGELEALTPGERGVEQRAGDLLTRLGLDLLIVSQAERGAMAFTADGERTRVAPQRAVEVADSVGAGDAFSSVMILGLLQRWPLRLSLERAQQFASAIVGIRGAVAVERGFYAPFLRQWELSQAEWH
jgi:fructokinase